MYRQKTRRSSRRSSKGASSRTSKRVSKKTRKLHKGGFEPSLYKIPKEDQYVVGGERFFQVRLEPSATAVMDEFGMFGDGKPGRVVIRDLQLTKDNLRNYSFKVLRAIVKFIIKIEPVRNKKMLIDQILANMEYEV
jgi:hypothetical protein